MFIIVLSLRLTHVTNVVAVRPKKHNIGNLEIIITWPEDNLVILSSTIFMQFMF